MRSVIAAIRRSEAIEVKHQSLSRPEPRWRRVAPHAIGFEGFRWHMRAFCFADRSFKDFLLSRIVETRGTEPSARHPADRQIVLLNRGNLLGRFAGRQRN